MGDDFFGSMGFNSHFSNMSGERDGGAGGIAYVGGNDTATTSVVTFNANPDYHLLERNAERENPYFPKLRADRLNHMHAHKGLLGFKVMGFHPSLADDARRPYGMDRDQVTYIDNLNGMGQARNEELLIELTDKIRVMGLIEHDIKAGSSREAGSPSQNNLVAAGKKTMPNSGPMTIRSGQKFMWALPSVEGGVIKGSSTDLIENIEKGLAPLLTVPYIPTAHKGSPQMIYRSLMAGSSNQLDHMNRADSAGTFRDAISILDSIKGIILIGQAALGGNTDEDANRLIQLKDTLKFGDTTSEFSKKLIKTIFNPLENPVFNNVKINPTELTMGRGPRYPTHATTGGSKGSLGQLSKSQNGQKVTKSSKQDIVRVQMRAFAELYAGIASVETRFRERIIGLAYTTASKGRDMDVLLNMAGNGSI